MNLPMLCACLGQWFRWWCLVVSKLQKQKLQSPPQGCRAFSARPVELARAIDISEEVVLHEDFQSTEIPEGEARS